MLSLIIFSNFRINDLERFTRMKDSFHSIKSINALKWVINVRGIYSKDVKKYLEDNLKDLVVVSEMESGKGWFYDTRRLINNINSDYLLYWTEDHINLVPTNNFPLILNEMSVSDSEYLFISWFIFDKLTGVYDKIEKKELNHIYYFTLNNKLSKEIKKSYPDHYIISAQGIFKTQLFKKIIKCKHPFLRRWPKETPFDLEKKITDTVFLPLKTAIPKYEIFAPIDDDMGGYPCSLQTRGLYPKRELRVISNPNFTPNFLIKTIKRVSTIKQRKLLINLIIEPYFKVTKFFKRIGYHF